MLHFILFLVFILGKTTLLTNIGSGNIEGLPPTMRMVYVQHDDRTEDHGKPLIEELLQSPDMIKVNVTAEQATAGCRGGRAESGR